MIIDCHYHYYPYEFDADKKIAEMDEKGLEKIALIPPISDLMETQPEVPMIRLLRSLEGKKFAFKLIRKLLCTFAGDGIDVLGEHYKIYFRSDNDSVFEFAEKHPDRFYAWAGVNPDIQDRAELEKEISVRSKSPVFCGVKAHPFYHQYNAEKLEPVFEMLDASGIAILIHMGFEDKEAILSLADKYKNVKVLLAHCAFPYFDMMWKEIASRPNIYVDISSCGYIDKKIAKRAVKALGADRCLYGSDGPFGPGAFGNKFDLKSQYDFAMPDVSEEDKKKISEDNFRKLIQRF